ncbi:MAG: ABC transporter permease [bacterium]
MKRAGSTYTMRMAEAVFAVRDMLHTQRLRGSIIVLCTAAGVAFLIAIVAIVNGLGRQLEHDVLGKLYGFNTIQLQRESRDTPNEVRHGDELRRQAPPLTLGDAEWLGGRIPTGATLAYSYSGSADVGAPGAPAKWRTDARILAASASQFVVQSLDVRVGRPFTDYEAQRGASVVVLGAEVAMRVFGARAAVGQIVDVAGLPYRVVGVLEHRGKFLGFSMDKLVVVPARSHLNGVINTRDELDAISIRVAHDSLMAPAQVVVEGAMRVRHGLEAAEKNDFQVSSSETLMDAWRRIRRIMLIVGPALTGVALIVAVLVTMNIMLVVVTERVPEIGLRRALGARRSDILTQFLAESVTLSVTGGLIGVLIGTGLAATLRAIAAIPTSVAPSLALLGLAVSVIVGVSAGAYPAYRASSLSPIEALGRE